MAWAGDRYVDSACTRALTWALPSPRFLAEKLADTPCGHRVRMHERVEQLDSAVYRRSPEGSCVLEIEHAAHLTVMKPVDAAAFVEMQIEVE